MVKLLIMMLDVIANSLWFIIGAGIIYAIGKTIDVFVREGRFLFSIISVTISLIAMALFTIGAIGILQNLVLDPDPVRWDDVYLYVFGGAVMTFIGWVAHNYIREHIAGAPMKSS